MSTPGLWVLSLDGVQAFALEEPDDDVDDPVDDVDDAEEPDEFEEPHAASATTLRTAAHAAARRRTRENKSTNLHARGRGLACTPMGHCKPAMAEIIDVADDLWVWRTRHPDWQPDEGWDQTVTSTCVRSGGESILIDPLAPESPRDEVWLRIDAAPPTAVLVLKPDHVRDTDLFVRRYGARAFGPDVFGRNSSPRSELELVLPGSRLPGGLVAQYDGRGRNETPVWLPEQQVLVFADALTAPAPGHELRVWWTPWHEERVLPALRDLLALPFEQVIVSHGEPVHDRAAFERALELTPWGR